MTLPNLSSRQHEILQLLMSSSRPSSLQTLAETTRVSIRTIQREIQVLNSYLREYGLELQNDPGVGFSIQGCTQNQAALVQDLKQAKVFQIYPPEIRQQRIGLDLLKSTDAVKTFTLSRRYGVAEATISCDLDRVEEWLSHFELRLIRRPGLGLYVEGPEESIRKATSSFLHQQITVEQWLEIFHGNDGSLNPSYGVQGLLTDFIDLQTVSQIEEVIREVLETQQQFELSEREYVNLVIHLALAIDRIRCEGHLSGETAEMDVQTLEGYQLACEMVKRLEKALLLPIPDSELGYIVLHLQGARLRAISENPLEAGDDAIWWLELARRLVRSVSVQLDADLSEDRLLLDGLMTHLIPVYHRLTLGLQIHNPMLHHLKSQYPEVFQACKIAVEEVGDWIGCEIPEAEIGYLAMHVGAAFIRQKEGEHRRLTAIVICASGFGTSQFLVSRLQTELPAIDVVEVVSALHLDEWLDRHPSPDLLISTVEWPHVHHGGWVIVSPFLTPSDIKIIQQRVNVKPLQYPQTKTKRMVDMKTNQSALAIARYGEGLTQLLRNFRLIVTENLDGSNVESVLGALCPWNSIVDFDVLCRDLREREKKGAFVFGNLVMLHAKTSGIKELHVAVIHAGQPFRWHQENNSRADTVLLLLAPSGATKEQVEMISEISAGLAEEDFFGVMTRGTEQEVKQSLEQLLTARYSEKTNQLLRE